MNTRALDKRSAKRTKMVLGLRVPPQRFHLSDMLVHTLDISYSGARIGAVREGVQLGSVLTVQRKHTRTQCRVMWSRNVAPGEIQIGIEFMGRDTHFWGLDLEEDGVAVWSSESER